MTKLLVLSDSHGARDAIKRILNKEQNNVDAVIFLGDGLRDLEQALAFLKRIREEYRDATHNCYAYVIGENAGIMRYSDDGEPGGTAGLPMMEVLKARGVVNLCVVVTRYFGGILLGAGGLVRAYSHSCALALDAAQVSIMELTQRVLFDVPYPLWDKFSYALQSLPCILEPVSYTHLTLPTN